MRRERCFEDCIILNVLLQGFRGSTRQPNTKQWTHSLSVSSTEWGLVPESTSTCYLLSFFFNNFNFYFILLYNTVLVLPYIDMNPPQVYMSFQSWTPLPSPTPYHLSGTSPCTSPKHPVSCIEHRLAIHFLHDSIHVSMPFSQIIPPSPSPSPSESKNTNTVY